TFEVQIRQAPGEPSPVERLSANYSSTHPQEWFARVGGVRVLGILDVEVPAVFAGGVLHPLFLLLPSGRPKAAIHGLKRPSMRAEVAVGIDGGPGLEHQNFHAS